MKLQEYYTIICDIWQLLKKYLTITGSDDYVFDMLHKDTNAIASKYGDHPFTRDLLLAVIDEIERTRT